MDKLAFRQEPLPSAPARRASKVEELKWMLT
jgi:hypothetical protein